jgi:hypothetical protein
LIASKLIRQVNKNVKPRLRAYLFEVCLVKSMIPPIGNNRTGVVRLHLGYRIEG